MRRIIFLEDAQSTATRGMRTSKENIRKAELTTAGQTARAGNVSAKLAAEEQFKLDKSKAFMPDQKAIEADAERAEALARERNVKANPKYLENTSRVNAQTFDTPAVTNINSSLEPNIKSFDELLIEVAEDYGKKEREKQYSQSNAVHHDSLLFNDEGGKLLKDIVNNTHDSEDSESKVMLSYIESNILAKNVLKKLRALLKKPNFDAKKAQEYKSILKGYIAEARKGE